MLVLEDVGYYISKNFHKEEMTPKRKVKWYEVELYKTQEGISFINGEKFPHRRGNILVSIPGDVRQSKKSFECHSVKFSQKNDGIERYMEEMHGVMQTVNEGRIERIYTQIYRAVSEDRPGGELYIDAKLRELIYEIYSEKNTYNNTHEFSAYIKNIYTAAEFIRKNYAKGISLNEMAAAADLSPAFFHMIFKNVIGQTPWEYLNRTRLNNAKLLLENTSLSIERTAHECGFSNRQYFDTVFKKSEGITPAVYRKSIHRTI